MKCEYNYTLLKPGMDRCTDADAVMYTIHVLMLAVYESPQPYTIDNLAKPRYDYVVLPLFYVPC